MPPTITADKALGKAFIMPESYGTGGLGSNTAPLYVFHSDPRAALVPSAEKVPSRAAVSAFTAWPACRLADAEQAFRGLLAQQYFDLAPHLVPLIHLQLARTLAKKLRINEADREYQTFLHLCSRADSEQLLLVQALREQRALVLGPVPLMQANDVATATATLRQSSVSSKPRNLPQLNKGHLRVLRWPSLCAAQYPLNPDTRNEVGTTDGSACTLLAT